MKVLYIAGWDRSGSTILDLTLGQLPGFFSVGELRYVWDRGVIENRRCGCGEHFRECEVWRDVFRRAFGGFDECQPLTMLALREESDRMRRMLRPGRLASRAGFHQYQSVLVRLYRALNEVTKARVIVDSSKTPTHGYLLKSSKAFELFVVHLTRDPRAIAYSWRRRKLTADAGPGYMRRMSPVMSSLLWSLVEVTAGRLADGAPSRYTKVRYEDFVAHPRETLTPIVSMLDEDPAGLPLVSDKELRLRPVHGVSGNPNRFKTGLVTLRADDEWRFKMKKLDRFAASALAGPFLRRSGYSLIAD